MRLLQLTFLLALASGIAAILIYMTYVPNIDGTFRLSNVDLEALKSLQSHFKKCVNPKWRLTSANGLGVQAVSGRDQCEVSLKFPSDTISKWKDPKTGELEGLSFDFNLCEAVATWEQVRNSTTVLTREFIDALPNGWEEYAWRRINKGVLLNLGCTGMAKTGNKCGNRTLCMEKLSLVLPDRSPYTPKQFGRCAVIGNSGDLLKTKFGKEIDSYEAIVRENGAPIDNFTEYVGTKSTFRLLNRGSAKALDKVAELYDRGKEVLLVKTTIHDIMNKMIREVPIINPVYLMLGTSFGSAAKGTGLKALEFALSICDAVDMYGFTVDPGYKEWTRYFSESRQGHTPLQGRAYYQMMECLGLIRIHSPMRPDPDRIVKWVPSRSLITAARIASEKLLRRLGAGSSDPLAACSIIAKQLRVKPSTLLSSSKAAVLHQKYVRGATMYPLEGNSGHGLLCTVPSK
ncbi:Sialyltransferase-like protein 2 [Orobanche hederae]